MNNLFLLFPFLGALIPDPQPKPPAINEGDIIELIKIMRRIEESNKTLLNTLALTTQQMIDLRVDVGTFAAESRDTRVVRSNADIIALEGELEVLNKRLENLRTVGNGDTTDKIKSAVQKEVAGSVAGAVSEIRVELKKNQVDWTSVRQTAINAAAGSLVVAIMWAIIQAIANGPK